MDQGYHTSGDGRKSAKCQCNHGDAGFNNSCAVFHYLLLQFCFEFIFIKEVFLLKTLHRLATLKTCSFRKDLLRKEE